MDDNKRKSKLNTLTKTMAEVLNRQELADLVADELQIQLDDIIQSDLPEQIAEDLEKAVMALVRKQLKSGKYDELLESAASKVIQTGLNRILGQK